MVIFFFIGKTRHDDDVSDELLGRRGEGETFRFQARRSVFYPRLFKRTLHFMARSANLSWDSRGSKRELGTDEQRYTKQTVICKPYCIWLKSSSIDLKAFLKIDFFNALISKAFIVIKMGFQILFWLICSNVSTCLILTFWLICIWFCKSLNWFVRVPRVSKAKINRTFMFAH